MNERGRKKVSGRKQENRKRRVKRTEGKEN